MQRLDDTGIEGADRDRRCRIHRLTTARNTVAQSHGKKNIIKRKNLLFAYVAVWTIARLLRSRPRYNDDEGRPAANIACKTITTFYYVIYRFPREHTTRSTVETALGPVTKSVDTRTLIIIVE